MRRILFFIIIILPFLALSQQGQQKGKNRDSGGDKSINREPRNDKSMNRAYGSDKGMREEATFLTEVPMHDYDIIVGCVTENSAVISVNVYAQYDYYIEMDGKKYTGSNHIDISGLRPDTEYSFKLFYSPRGENDFRTSTIYSFRTRRPAESSFSFTITADPHLDQNSDTTAFRKIMQAISGENSDFHLDLGDTFMTEKYGGNYKESASQYLAMRYYFGLTHKPLYLVVGNHDATYKEKNPTMWQWAKDIRDTYFPTPGSYYSFEWGDALFVVLDPYLNTPNLAKRNSELKTLGIEQIAWLKKTLEKSNAKYKFIFTHSLVGGADGGQDRGGVEAAHLHEWGKLIHPILVKYGVNAVFKGHDHLFVKQELDGIVYQTLPQPAARQQGRQRPDAQNDNAVRIAKEYGYESGCTLGGSGYLYVNVSPEWVNVAYKNAFATIFEYKIF